MSASPLAGAGTGDSCGGDLVIVLPSRVGAVGPVETLVAALRRDILLQPAS